MKKKISKAIRLTELYEPYVFFYGRYVIIKLHYSLYIFSRNSNNIILMLSIYLFYSFDEVNAEKLRLAMKEINMDQVLNFDSRCIKWEDYFMNAHIPGAVKYLF